MKVPKIKKYDCDIPGRKVVTIDDCIDCYRLCVHNPKSWASREWNSDFIRRWGVEEIERFLSGLKSRVPLHESGGSAYIAEDENDQ